MPSSAAAVAAVVASGGRSKNRYRHFTNVEGTDAVVRTFKDAAVLVLADTVSKRKETHVVDLLVSLCDEDVDGREQHPTVAGVLSFVHLEKGGNGSRRRLRGLVPCPSPNLLHQQSSRRCPKPNGRLRSEPTAY